MNKKIVIVVLVVLVILGLGLGLGLGLKSSSSNNSNTLKNTTTQYSPILNKAPKWDDTMCKKYYNQCKINIANNLIPESALMDNCIPMMIAMQCNNTTYQ